MIALGLDPDEAPSLQRQVYRGLTRLILGGTLKPGQRLPSSRTLARELGVARNTTLAALDQLAAEGYVEARAGSGTYVSGDLGFAPSSRPEPALAPSAVPVNRWAGQLASSRPAKPQGLEPFRPGLPDLTDFPFALWARLLARSWRAPGPPRAYGDDPAGDADLRQAIAEHLGLARGVRAEPDQVLIVTSIRRALDLVARVLLEPGQPVWLEDPGFPGSRGPLVAAGARLVPVPVDQEGLSVAAGLALEPHPRLIVTAPSHQYPLGMTMSLARRLQLLEVGARVGAVIFEDDYDSEWRYDGRPLAALQGLDRTGRVLYAGSFTKALFPALRIGYLIAPKGLAERFGAARAALGDQPDATAQAALARFIREGHYLAHLRRQRRRYRRRQALLLAGAKRHLDGLLSLAPDPAGMHLVAYLAPALARRMGDVEAEARAAAAGLITPPLSRFWIGAPERQGLMIGYTAMAEEAIEPALERLAQALSDR